MKELIKDIPKDFINSNKHIWMIKEGLGVLANIFGWMVIFLYICPLLISNYQKSAQNFLFIEISSEEAMTVVISMMLIPIFIWIIANVFTYSPKRIFHSFIPLLSLCFVIDILNYFIEIGVTKGYYNHYLLLILIVTVAVILEYLSINLVNIVVMKRSYSKVIIAEGDGVSVDIVLGKKSRFAFLKNLFKSTTYFYYDGNICFECIDNGLKEYDHNELILGTKDAMYSTVGITKFKNIIDTIIYIPDEYNKSRKYYYGVIRYLEHKGIGMWTIKFAGSNQSEIIKANSILETIKKHDMYLHEENGIMSKPEYLGDVADIYDYSPFYMKNIKLCMEDNDSFKRVSREMSDRTKMSIEIQAERLNREGVTLP